MTRNRITTINHRARAARWFMLCTIAALVAAIVVAPLPAAAQDAPAVTPAATPAPSVVEAGSLEACSNVDEASIQDELNRVTQAVFADALARVDVPAIVDAQWRNLGLNATVARVVDDAADGVRAETDVWNKFLSGWSGDKARELTLEISRRAFASEDFRQAMDALSAAVAVDVADQMGALSAESSSAALYCLQTFIQQNYSPALLTAFQDAVTAGASGGADLLGDNSNAGIMGVIQEHSLALGGIGVIVAAQVAKRIVVTLTKEVSERVAGRVVTRVLGRVGSTVIPLAGWVVGAGMIAYDLWNNADGALPQIQASLQSEEVMAGIRSEISSAIATELGPELPQVARDVADSLYSQWTGVKRDIRVVLELANESDAFQNVLVGIESPDQLQRLVAISGALTGASGRSAVLAAAESGALARALQSSADITPVIRATGSLDTALDWVAAAGELLPDVVRLEIYAQKSPADLDRATLQRLIALDNAQTVSDLALLPNEQLATMLVLSSESLRVLAGALTPEQLGWLAETIAPMAQSERNILVSRLVSDPALIGVLQNSNLLDELPPGADIDAAVAFLSGRADALGMFNDAIAVVTGPATAGMYQGKYGWGTSLLVGLASLLIMLIALRLLWAAGAWILAPVFTIGRLGGRRPSQPPAPPTYPPPDAPRQSMTYGPRATRPQKPAPAAPRDDEEDDA